MSFLPKIDVATYTINLPVSKQTVKFRPYLVKEQKILIMAKESGEKNTLVNAIIQVLENCVINDVDIKELPITDVEYLFYSLRARSESEIVDLKYRCESIVGGKPCGNVMEHGLNLINDLEIIKNDVSPNIQINEEIGLKLRHQRFEIDNLENKIPTPEEILESIAKNVEFVYDDTSSYNAKDIPIQKIVEWLGDLPVEKFKEIEAFLENEPRIVKQLQITCSKCGTVHDILVEDIFDFFI